MQKFTIMLDNFGHDGSGNPIARHTVFSYLKKDQALDSPSAELYATKQRKQVGYGNNRDDYAGTALENAGVKNVKLVDVEGNRSNGAMWLIYEPA